MEAKGTQNAPTPPYSGIFACGAVSGTWYVAQHPIENTFLVLVLLVLVVLVHGRPELRIDTGQKGCGGIETSELMNEHVCAFGVGIVGNDKAGGFGGVGGYFVDYLE